MKKIFFLILLISKISLAENEIKSPWSFAYFGYYSSQLSDSREGGASIYSYHQFYVNYKLNERFVLSLRPSITYNSGGTSYGEKIKTNSKASESQLVFVDKNPISLSNDIKSKATYKVYLPTDAKWNRIGTKTALGAGIEFNKKMYTLFTLGFESKFIYLFQSNNTYEIVEGNPSTLTPTLGSQFENTLKLEMALGEHFSVVQALGLKDQLYNENTILQSSSSHFIVIETLLNYIINDNADFSVGLAQNADAEDMPFSLYNDYESAYEVMLSLRF